MSNIQFGTAAEIVAASDYAGRYRALRGDTDTGQCDWCKRDVSMNGDAAEPESNCIEVMHLAHVKQTDQFLCRECFQSIVNVANDFGIYRRGG